MSEKNKKDSKTPVGEVKKPVVEKTEAGKVEKTEAGKVEKTEAVKVEKVEATTEKVIKSEAPPVPTKEEKKQTKPKFRNLGLIDHHSIYLRDVLKNEAGEILDKDLNGDLVPEGRKVFVIRTKSNEDIPIAQLPAAPVTYDVVDNVNVAYKEPKIRKQDDGIKAINHETGNTETAYTYKQHTVFVEGVREEKGSGDKMVEIAIGYVGRWNTVLTQEDVAAIQEKEAAKETAKAERAAAKAEKKKEKEAKMEKVANEAAAKANAAASVTGAAGKDIKDIPTPTKSEKEEVVAPAKAEKKETAKK